MPPFDSAVSSFSATLGASSSFTSAGPVDWARKTGFGVFFLSPLTLCQSSLAGHENRDDDGDDGREEEDAHNARRRRLVVDGKAPPMASAGPPEAHFIVPPAAIETSSGPSGGPVEPSLLPQYLVLGATPPASNLVSTIMKYV